MKSIMKPSSLLFIIFIGMMLMSGNSIATEDHEQNKDLMSEIVTYDITLDKVAVPSFGDVANHSAINSIAPHVIQEIDMLNNPVTSNYTIDIKVLDGLTNRMTQHKRERYQSYLYSWNHNNRLDTRSNLQTQHIDPGINC